MQSLGLKKKKRKNDEDASGVPDVREAARRRLRGSTSSASAWDLLMEGLDISEEAEDIS